MITAKPPYEYRSFLLRHNTRTHVKNVDQASGQVENPELVVGDAGRSAIAQRALARQVKKRSPTVSGMSLKILSRPATPQWGLRRILEMGS